MELKFPVGFHDFHSNFTINFQMNRWYSTGILQKEELMEIGKKIHNFEEWTNIFTDLAQKAENEGRYESCATYFRAAQFFALGDEKDANGNLLKISLYDKCLTAYEKAYQNEGIVYCKVPYKDAALPVMYKKHSKGSKGTILLHGGYDSFIQEFVRYMLYLYEAGYDIYMFEGFGQGEALCRYHLKMHPDWENCTTPILDYFNLNDVTIVGISLGGYLAPRAASVEKRIKRVVMFDLIYDFYGSLLSKMKPKTARFLDYLTRHPKNLMWKYVERNINRNFFTKWIVEQGYFVFENVQTPCEFYNEIKKYNTKTLSPLLTQDVLIFAGTKDLYTKYLSEQLDALTNARSVESRVFSNADHASHHCQVGNVKLALDYLISWINRVSA